MVSTPQTVTEIWNALQKESDEYTMRFLVRPLSFLSSFLLIRYTNVSPNIVSLTALLLALIGSFFFFLGGFQNQIIGVVCASLYIILDCVDGNIARVKNLKSLLGRWLDGAGGFIVTPLFIFSLLWGLGSPSLFILGSLAMIAYPLQYLIVFFYKSRITQNNDPLPLSSQPSTSLVEKLRFMYGSALFFPLLVLAVVFHRVYDFMLFYAVVGNMVWVITLIIQLREILKLETKTKK